ncbi:MAG: hypothetical protein ABFR50_00025 [Candidatus Fermentibacteria bacterium]
MKSEIAGKCPAKAIKIVGFTLLGLIGVTVLAILFGIFVKFLWNALLPDIFGLPEIGYWQAVGLAVLAHIFFGAHGGTSKYKKSRNVKKSESAEEVEKNALSREMELDYAEFWREEGREAFKAWMQRENGSETEDS